jgi:RNA polymerase sigma-70 factor, ECF subfamily
MALPLWFGGPPNTGDSHGGFSPGDAERPRARARESLEYPADAELLRRIRSSDADALDTLAERYVARLVDVAATVTDSHDLAADAVQDTLIWLWDHRAELDVRTSLVAYLVRAVRHRALRLKRQEETRFQLGAKAMAASEIIDDANGLDAERHLEIADRDAAVQAALQSLAPRAREILLMRIDLELSYSEIAKTLGVSVNTVNTHL